MQKRKKEIITARMTSADKQAIYLSLHHKKTDRSEVHCILPQTVALGGHKTGCYAGNFRDLAGLLRKLARRGQETVSLMEEAQELLTDDTAVYQDIQRKKDLLEGYARRCIHNVSGRTIDITVPTIGGTGGPAMKPIISGPIRWSRWYCWNSIAW